MITLKPYSNKEIIKLMQTKFPFVKKELIIFVVLEIDKLDPGNLFKIILILEDLSLTIEKARKFIFKSVPFLELNFLQAIVFCTILKIHETINKTMTISEISKECNKFVYFYAGMWKIIIYTNIVGILRLFELHEIIKISFDGGNEPNINLLSDNATISEEIAKDFKGYFKNIEI